jgi:hypothetical protein
LTILRWFFVGLSLTWSFFLISCSEVLHRETPLLKTTIDLGTTIKTIAPINGKQTLITRIQSPEQILRQTIFSLEKLLGKPSFRRDEGDAIVFQYSQDWCIFDVVFYGNDEAKTASYYEFRTTDGRDLNILECLHKVVTGQLEK